MLLSSGQKAPEFSLPDQNGHMHKLIDYRGKWVLLYFYPKDGTSGCTKEACLLRDSFPKFQGINAAILGVSMDSMASHKLFTEENHLPFTLLADEKKEVVQRYGVWQKSILGEAVKRTSFLLRPDGVIAKIYDKVNPAIHAQEVLIDLEDMK